MALPHHEFFPAHLAKNRVHLYSAPNMPDPVRNRRYPAVSPLFSGNRSVPQAMAASTDRGCLYKPVKARRAEPWRFLRFRAFVHCTDEIAKPIGNFWLWIIPVSAVHKEITLNLFELRHTIKTLYCICHYFVLFCQ